MARSNWGIHTCFDASRRGWQVEMKRYLTGGSNRTRSTGETRILLDANGLPAMFPTLEAASAAAGANFHNDSAWSQPTAWRTI